MRHGRRAARGVAIAVFGLFLAGCGSQATPTTSTTTSVPQSATSQAPETTSVTAAEVGPQPLPSGGFLEPGDYVTNLFEPTVLYTIETRHIGPFEDERSTGIQNRRPRSDRVIQGLGPYRGVAIHNVWLRLDPDEIVEELEERERLTLGDPIAVEIAGFPGTQFDTIVEGNEILWSAGNANELGVWELEAGQVTRLIILETPAGSLLITIGADAEEWDEFLPITEQILAGISFPDMESG